MPEVKYCIDVMIYYLREHPKIHMYFKIRTMCGLWLVRGIRKVGCSDFRVQINMYTPKIIAITFLTKQIILKFINLLYCYNILL